MNIDIINISFIVTQLGPVALWRFQGLVTLLSDMVQRQQARARRTSLCLLRVYVSGRKLS